MTSILAVPFRPFKYCTGKERRIKVRLSFRSGNTIYFFSIICTLILAPILIAFSRMAHALTGRDVIAEITASLPNFCCFCAWDSECDGSAMPNVPIPGWPSSTDLGTYVTVSSDAEMIKTISDQASTCEMASLPAFKFPISFSYLLMGRSDGHEIEKPILRRVWECEDLEKSILELVPLREMEISSGGSDEGERVDHEMLFLENKEMCKHKLHVLRRSLLDIVPVQKWKDYGDDWNDCILQRLKEMTREDERHFERRLLERVEVLLNGSTSAKRMG